jgi:hypothetical protein
MPMPPMSMPPTPPKPHRYLVILGSCCTADGLRETTFEAVATSTLRLLLYQGRTSFLGLTTGAMREDEFAYTEEASAALGTEWGLRMAMDEVTKRHRCAIDQVIGMCDALLVDNVSAFTFPSLVDGEGRVFLKSWEWERYVVPKVPLKEKAFWELSTTAMLAAARESLQSWFERRPQLTLVFHFPEPSFDDGVDFASPGMRQHLDCYRRFNERLHDEACRAFPRVAVLTVPTARADPHHHNGPHPFHFEKSYGHAVKEALARVLW